MKYFVEVEGRSFEVDLAPDGITVDGAPVETDLAAVAGTAVRHLILDGASHPLVARRTGDGRWDLHLRGRRIEAEAVDERTRVIREMTGAAAGPSGPKPIKAPMPGLVIKVEVAVGDVVAEGQGVVIVEAMKMENELRAQAAATVAAVHVQAGDTVERDQVLVDFEVPT